MLKWDNSCSDIQSNVNKIEIKNKNKFKTNSKCATRRKVKEPLLLLLNSQSNQGHIKGSQKSYVADFLSEKC